MTAIITYRVLLSNMLRCSYVLGDSYLVARSVRCEIPHLEYLAMCETKWRN